MKTCRMIQDSNKAKKVAAISRNLNCAFEPSRRLQVTASSGWRMASRRRTRQSSKTGDTPWDLHSSAQPRMTGYMHTNTLRLRPACTCTHCITHPRVCQPAQTESFRQAEAVTVSPCRTADTPRSLNPYLARQINWSALLFTVTELQGEGEGSPQPYTNS